MDREPNSLNEISGKRLNSDEVVSAQLDENAHEFMTKSPWQSAGNPLVELLQKSSGLTSTKQTMSITSTGADWWREKSRWTNALICSKQLRH